MLGSGVIGAILGFVVSLIVLKMVKYQRRHTQIMVELHADISSMRAATMRLQELRDRLVADFESLSARHEIVGIVNWKQEGF